MQIEVITNNGMSSLAKYSRDAICIRAIMAYWTIPSYDLPSEFLKGLQATGGQLCVDIHNPTSIDALHSIQKCGVDVRLLLVSTTGKSEIDDSTSMPNHLMHSKVIIFDYKDQDSVVWVGSHNGTFRALDGVNYECSLAIKTPKKSALYEELQQHLKEVADDCSKFNPNLILHYRLLQGNLNKLLVNTIEFENESNVELQIGEEITIFNLNNKDHTSMRKLDNELIISLHNDRENIYKGKLIQTGETPVNSSQFFGNRRYADRQKRELPILLNTTSVTSSMYQKNTYFAIFRIAKIMDASHQLLDVNNDRFWVNAPLGRFKNKEKPFNNSFEVLQIRKTKAKGLKFQIPEIKDILESDKEFIGSSEFQVHLKVLKLDEKRILKRPSLIVKKILQKN